MSSASITFRCYQCGKLLGASPAKAGSVVACPKCKAELLVPAPASATQPQAPAPGGGEVDEATAFIRKLVQGGPIEPRTPAFPEIRTEPAAPGKSRPPVPQPASPTPAHPVPPPAPEAGAFPFVAVDEPTSLRPTPPQKRPKSAGPSGSNIGRSPAAAPANPSASNVLPANAEFVPPSRADEPIIPTVEFPTGSLRTPPNRPASPIERETVVPSVQPWPTIPDTPSSIVMPEGAPPTPMVRTGTEPIRSEPRPSLIDRDGPRRNDVILPRSAVLLWSFFVVAALGAAFVAGLLAGHYVWK